MMVNCPDKQVDVMDEFKKLGWYAVQFLKIAGDEIMDSPIHKE